MTNAHVGGNKHWSVELKTDKGALIGNATVGLKNNVSEAKYGDLAILVIDKKIVQGEELIPINMTFRVNNGDASVLVSGNNETVSGGQLFYLDNTVLLLDAYTIDGDSGSPYLVKRDGEYRVAGINAKEGPVGMLFTPEIIEEMRNALDKKPSIFKSTKDNETLETVRNFLDNLNKQMFATETVGLNINVRKTFTGL